MPAAGAGPDEEQHAAGLDQDPRALAAHRGVAGARAPRVPQPAAQLPLHHQLLHHQLRLRVEHQRALRGRRQNTPETRLVRLPQPDPRNTCHYPQ